MGGRKHPPFTGSSGTTSTARGVMARFLALWVEMGLKPVASSLCFSPWELLLRAAWGLSGQQDLPAARPWVPALPCTPPSRVPEMLSAQLSLGTFLSRSLCEKSPEKYSEAVCVSNKIHVVSSGSGFHTVFLGSWTLPGCQRGAKGQTGLLLPLTPGPYRVPDLLTGVLRTSCA